MYVAMLHAGAEIADTCTLRLAISGGAALPVEVLRGFEQAFDTIVLEGYGLSETSPVASFNTPTQRKPGSIGVPIAGVEIKLVDVEGEVGEIAIRGHNVMKGYWQRPDASMAAIRDGWFHTGDMARRDDDGFYFIVDRKKDLIIRGGYNVYPREIEEVLYEHPAVLEAAVVGTPHPTHGEEVVAAVALRPDADSHPGGAARVREGPRRRLQVPAPRVAGRRPAEGPDRQDAQARDRDPRRGSVMTAEAVDAPIDSAGSLDMLLADAALGAGRLLRPDLSTLRFLGALAGRPGPTLGRAKALAGELNRIARGSSTVTPSDAGPAVRRPGVDREPVAAQDRAGVPGHRPHRRGPGRRRRAGLARPRADELPGVQPGRGGRPVEQPAAVAGGVEGGDRFGRRERADGAAEPGQRPGHRTAGADDGGTGRIPGGRRPRAHTRGCRAAHRGVRADPLHAADRDRRRPRRCSWSRR